MKRRVVGVPLAALAGGAVALLLLGGLVLPNLGDLFGTETKDRSQPVVLRSIEKLSSYRAATANLQVIVDVEKDAKLLPSVIKGEKVLYVASGNVDAEVDFSKLDKDAIKVSEDRKSVTITLPAPKLGQARVDPRRSRVYDRDRGLFDRIESVFEDSPTGERELIILAQDKLYEAARSDAGVLQAAERNTRSMLEGLMRGLGFTRVKVVFTRAAATSPEA